MTTRKANAKATELPGDVVDDVESNEGGEGQSDDDGSDVGVEGEA